ncbi:MAG TPA: hypothetical protein VHB73_06340 [Alphaproteobacteria bacterium]|nr:hypothetical protein [Alphaproteobacteria bacterium]
MNAAYSDVYLRVAFIMNFYFHRVREEILNPRQIVVSLVGGALIAYGQARSPIPLGSGNAIALGTAFGIIGHVVQSMVHAMQPPIPPRIRRPSRQKFRRFRGAFRWASGHLHTQSM